MNKISNECNNILDNHKRTLIIMRISLFFLFIGILSSQAMNSFSQETKFTFNLKSIAIKEVCNEIEKKSDFRFVFSSDARKITNQKISLNVDSETINNILDIILSNTNLTYNIIDNQVAIFKDANKKPATEKTIPDEIIQPEKKKVTGKITDKNGESIIGANIIEKGTGNGTVTDIDGSFTLNVAPNALLQVSYIGYLTQEVSVAGKTSFRIVMQEDNQTLQDVVVTGYQIIDQKLFTGAANKVKMDDIKISGESDLSKVLEGRVAGVSVQNVSSTFGTAPKIKIRGSSSIYGYEKPLWVIDGVVLEDAIEVSMDQLNTGDLSTLISSGVAGLNMDDIESMQILKDVSATALYGARAMNGVIVIQTKKGRAGTLNINYSGNFTTRAVPSYSDFNILNSQEQMSVNRELYEKGWINVARTQFESIHGPFGKMFDRIKDKEINWVGTNDEMNAFLRKYETANTDWFDLLFQPGLMQQHTLSFSGGSDKASFYTSLGYLNDEGWTIADKMGRYTALMKGTYKITDKFTVVTTGNISYRDQQLSGVSNVSGDIGGVNRYTGKIERNFDNNPFMYALTTSRAIRPYDENGELEFFRRNFVDYNIVDELSKNKTFVTVRDMSFITDLNYDIRKDLSVSGKLSVRYFNSKRERMIHEKSNEANAYRAGMRDTDNEIIKDQNPFLYERPGSTTGEKYSILPEGGMLNSIDNIMTNYYFTGNVNWNPVFRNDHRFTFLLGSEVRYIDRIESFNDGYGHFFDYGNVSKPSQNYLEYLEMKGESYFGKNYGYDRFAAFFLNYGYSYLGKYILNGTSRLDGSNRLGKSTTARWLPTWNIGSKWLMGEEDFIKNIRWIDALNLRVSYGLNATLGAVSNATDLFYTGKSYRPLHPSASELSMRLYDLENRDLTWEKQYEFNVGLDAAFLSNRIVTEFNVYNRRGFDLIGLYYSNGVGGQILKTGNVADMNSHGVEFSINTTPVKSPDFKWDLGFNYAHNKNKITALNSNAWVSRAVSVFGIPVLYGPVRGIYSTRFAGLDNKGVPTFYDKDDNVVHYLDVQTSDLSNLVFSGNLEPSTHIGINNIFSYKGFTFSCLFTGQFGHKKRVMQNFNYYYTDHQALSAHMKNRWRMAGDEKKTNIPAIYDMTELMKHPEMYKIATAYNLYGMSDVWLADASFIRLKNIGFTYRLPQSWLQSLKIKQASLSLQGSNLALLWVADKKKLGGEDPEFVWSGGTTMPITKQYTFTLNIGF